MRKLLKLIIVLTVIVCLHSCMTKKVMQSWMGSHISQVIASWGAEDKKTEDGKGGYVYTWGSEYQLQHGGCTKMFYVNNKGTIYSWRYNGNCP